MWWGRIVNKAPDIKLNLFSVPTVLICSPYSPTAMFHVAPKYGRWVGWSINPSLSFTLTHTQHRHFKVTNMDPICNIQDPTKSPYCHYPTHCNYNEMRPGKMKPFLILSSFLFSVSAFKFYHSCNKMCIHFSCLQFKAFLYYVFENIKGWYHSPDSINNCCNLLNIFTPYTFLRTWIYSPSSLREKIYRATST